MAMRPAIRANRSKKGLKRQKDTKRMKLGMVITQTDPETVFNALRLALYSLESTHGL